MERIEAKFAWVRGQILKDIDILVDDGRIVKLGRKLNGGKKIDAKKSLVIPGLINSHVHLSPPFIRGMGIGLPVLEMFSRVLFPYEKALTPEQAYTASLVTGSNLLKGGVTSIHTMGIEYKGALKAMKELRFKGTISIANKDLDTSSQKVKERLSDNTKLVKKHSKGDIIGIYGIANEFESSKKLIKEVVSLSTEHRAGIHIHAAENANASKQIRRKEKKTSIGYLNELGVLGEKTLISHCVFIEPDDISVLASSGSTVVHCPTSNINLKNGIAPIPGMLKQGVKVALGTDTSVCNITDDLRHEMYTAQLTQRVRGAELRESTLMGMSEAGAYGMQLGKIEEGYPADMAFINLDDLRLVPFSLQNALFLGRITDVFINGNKVLEDGRLTVLDEAGLLRKAQAFAEQIQNKLK